MRNSIVRAFSVGVFACTLVTAEAQKSTTLTSPEQPLGTLGTSLQNEVNASVDRALDWLAANQKPDGSWSNSSFPALTALPVWAFAIGKHPQRTKCLKGGVDFIRGCVREDGGIYRQVEGRKGGGLGNYNTAICMTALHATRRADLISVVQNARKYVAESQHLGDDIYRGGFGYDKSTKRAYTDLLNTYYSVQAMRLTQDVEDLRAKGEKRVDIDWEETAKFVERLQAKPGSGADNTGGFAYNPSDPKAGTITNEAGVVYFRAYGSMTYAGLLALIYTNADTQDSRVASALDWSARHWTLEENPGMGHQGLFFFYNVLTRALDASGRDFVPLEGGKLLNWKEDLAEKLISLQKIDPKTGHGYWTNDTGRFWENDPVLATTYCLLALQNL
jgi:squalene-hopene/tetraprenyl-beta-curcumene cyclase